jgi:hypothetical protein
MEMRGQTGFLDYTYTWTEAVFGMAGDAYTRTYTFDSVATFQNGHDYYAIFYSDLENGGQWQNSYIYLRYEGNQIIYGNETEDYPILDFSLSLDDTFYIPFGAQYVVTSIDSVTLETGERRKRLEVHCEVWGDIPIYWIEGIGSTAGLANFYFTCGTDIGATLLCVHHQDTLIYQNPDYNTCRLISTSKEAPTEQIILSPNPFNDFITVTDTEHLLSRIRIIDTAGHEVYQGNESRIATSILIPGYYLLVLEFSDGRKQIEKRIKI